jgi:protein phosphatase
MSQTRLRCAGMSDVGRRREGNEDAWFAGDNVFAVADGLGGHKAGEVASTVAVEPLAALDAQGSRRAAAGVADAVRQANRAVFEQSQQDEDLKGMSTTMTAVAVHEGIAHIAHVGDSRCYLLRDGEISQLSRDHTLVARMVAEGKLSPEQAEAHPQRSILTRALGADRDVDVEETNVALVAGDRLLLCSDGLSGLLSSDEISAIATQGSDLDRVCQRLIDEANDRGGPDNITVVLVDVERVPAGGGLPKKPRDPAAARSGRRFPVRAAIWTMLVLLLVFGGWFGVRAWANRSYFVGVQDDQVTIYRGLPVDILGMELNKVEEQTPLEVAEIKNPAIRRSLQDGIRASSLAEARRIVEEQIEPAIDLVDGANGVEEPSPSESPTTRRRR